MLMLAKLNTAQTRGRRASAPQDSTSTRFQALRGYSSTEDRRPQENDHHNNQNHGCDTGRLCKVPFLSLASEPNSSVALRVLSPRTRAGNLERHRTGNRIWIMKSREGDPGSQPPDANKRSATSKAGGPKTAEGKRRVRHNALQHGFFSKQLIVRESEKAEFETLRSSLLTELEPVTTIQMIAFERLLCASWRVRQALRMEQATVNAELSLEAERENSAKDEVGGAMQVPRWYTAGRGPLSTALKFLQNLRQDISVNGGIHLEQHRDAIIKAFGSEFYDSLAQWKPANIDAILASEAMAYHAEAFKMPLPETVLSKEIREKVVIDPRAKWDMLVKLIDVKLQDLAEMYRLIAGEERSSDGQPVGPDNLGRYMTSALRELERAFQWYIQVTAVVSAVSRGTERD